MAIVAGAYSRRRNVPLPDGLDVALSRAISRQPAAQRQVWSDRFVAIIQAETGAYDDPAFIGEDLGVTAIAGDPVLRGRETSPDRTRLDDTRRLHTGFRAADLGILQTVTGPFALAHYSTAGHVLTLVSDKLAFRNLYYWMSDDLVVFASSLHIINTLEIVPKCMDIRGVLQFAPVGYMLGNGTTLANVRTLGAGEVMRFENGRVDVQRYWRLDHVRTSAAPVEDLADAVISALGTAIDRRLGQDRTSVAFLTGGMDTRLVVCELLRRNVRVHTLNGSHPGNQDQVCARLFANAVGTEHQEMPSLVADPGYPDQMAHRWYASAQRAAMPPEHPQVIWTGVGGSAGIGGGTMTADLLATLRAGRFREAVHQFVLHESSDLPHRVLTGSARRRYADLVEQCILAEYRSYEVDDPGRIPWLFAILNSNRRAYGTNVENIDLHGCESLVPFCDADLLTVLASVPQEYLLGHQFYMKVVERTDPRFFAAAWQTYPNHVPCPVTAPPDVPTQWAQRRPAISAASISPARLMGMIWSRDFPATLVDRARATSAAALMLLGLRDTRHSLQFVETVHHYFRDSGCQMM